MAATPAAAARGPVSLTAVELLHHELVSYLLKRHDDGRFASEELWGKLELAGYNVGRRFAERCVCSLSRANARSPPPPPLAPPVTPRPSF